MRYFDPARPLIGNRALAYLDDSNRPIAALPDLRIELSNDLEWPGVSIRLCLMLMVESNAARWFYSQPTGDLDECKHWIEEYLADPERFMRLRMGWTAPKAGAGQQAAAASADEMGL